MKLFLGICLLLLSLTPWIFYWHIGHAFIFFILWVAGYMETCNALIEKYSSQKIDHVSIPRRHIATIGLLAAFIIEYFGNSVWKLWYYPSFSLIIYVIVLPLILIGYFDILLKGYLAVRVIMIKCFGEKKIVKPKRIAGLFTALGILGGVGMIISIALTIPILSAQNPSSVLNTYGVAPFPTTEIILAFISFFFILEYLEYHEREDTFLIHLFQSDWTPLFSIAIASLLTSFLMEALNVPFHIWQYANWPYQNITLLGVPVAIIIAWFVQYPLLISAYHAMYRKETRRIWDD